MWVESKAIAASEKARAKVEELQNPGQNTIALAEHQVDQAQASLDATLARLNLLKNPNPADLAAAETAVAVAEQTLALNQGPHIRQAIEASQSQVDQAQAQVNLVMQHYSQPDHTRRRFSQFEPIEESYPGRLRSGGGRGSRRGTGLGAKPRSPWPTNHRSRVGFVGNNAGRPTGSGG